MDNPFEQYDIQRMDRLKTLTSEQMLGELLAVIHRDGGQYQEENGIAKAVFAAEKIIYAQRLAMQDAINSFESLVGSPIIG